MNVSLRKVLRRAVWISPRAAHHSTAVGMSVKTVMYPCVQDVQQQRQETTGPLDNYFFYAPPLKQALKTREGAFVLIIAVQRIEP